jgi:hypothetical protein
MINILSIPNCSLLPKVTWSAHSSRKQGTVARSLNRERRPGFGIGIEKRDGGIHLRNATRYSRYASLEKLLESIYFWRKRSWLCGYVIGIYSGGVGQRKETLGFVLTSYLRKPTTVSMQ